MTLSFEYDEAAIEKRLPEDIRNYLNHFESPSFDSVAFDKLPFLDFIVWDDNMEMQGIKAARSREDAWVSVAFNFFEVWRVVEYTSATPKEKRMARKLDRERGNIT